MRYQTHSESPILSNLILKLDIAKGSASCGIAVGEVGEVGEAGEMSEMGDNDRSDPDGVVATVHEALSVPPVNSKPALIHLPCIGGSFQAWPQ
jgi:hypothetical protein